MNANREASLKSFREPADEYCRIVEGAIEAAPLEVLKHLQLILPQLHLAALHLPQVDTDEGEGDPHTPSRSDKEWGILYERLKKILGQYDLYWTVFDPRDHNDQPLYLSLPDVFANTHFPLLPPLHAAHAGSP